MAAGARLPKSAFEVTTLADEAAIVETGDAAAQRLPVAGAYVFALDVTADESTAADRLDVFVQTKIDGTNWLDVIHFTQHAGNAGAVRYISKITRDLATAEFLNSAALAAANVRNIAGDEWRVRWAVTDDSTNAEFTFSVTAVPM